MPIEVIHPLARPVTTEGNEPETNALRSAGHAVLRTLYSRARRIWLYEASWLLRGLRKNGSSDLLLVDVVRVFAQPALELVIPLEQELERFTDDVGRSCVDELGVPVQVVSDFFLEANLESCSFWLFRRRFQQCHVLSIFSFSRCSAACITNCLPHPCAAILEHATSVPRAGATPRTFWAAEGRKSGVAPARFGVLSTASFLCAAFPFLCRTRTSLRYKVKKVTWKKVQSVISTFFTQSRGFVIALLASQVTAVVPRSRLGIEQKLPSSIQRGKNGKTSPTKFGLR